MFNKVVEYQFGIGQQDFPFDPYGGMEQGYSLRRLLMSYTGDCIRAKNLTTMAELDIPFVGGYIDTSLLLSFASGNSVGVSIFYDQSGNSRNLICDATNSVIVVSGVLNIENSKVVVDFDKIGGNTLAVFSPYDLGTLSIFYVNTPTSNSGYGGIYYNASTGNNGIFLASETVSTYQPNAIPTIGTTEQATKRKKSTVTPFGTMIQTNWNYDLISLSLNEDNVSQTLVTNAGGWSTDVRGSLGGFNGAVMSQRFAELVVFGNDKTSDSSAINTEQKNYYSIP